MNDHADKGGLTSYVRHFFGWSQSQKVMPKSLSTTLCVHSVHAVHGQSKVLWLGSSEDVFLFMLMCLVCGFERPLGVGKP